MKNNRLPKAFASIIVNLFLLSLFTIADVNASAIPYPNAGTENPTSYSFTATNTGDITGYFAGASTFFDSSRIELFVNGSSRVLGPENTSSYGNSVNFGSASAGDTLTFKLNVVDGTNTFAWYSEKSLNSDNVNHLYSTGFGGDNLIPAGTYLAFEDLAYSPTGFSTDFNYNDQNMVLTNVSVSAVPVPAAIWLFGSALLGLASVSRRKFLSLAMTA
jgi:hypothetical protein